MPVEMFAMRQARVERRSAIYDSAFIYTGSTSAPNRNG